MKFNRYLSEILVTFFVLVFILAGLYNVVRYKDTGSGGGTDNFYDIHVPVDVIIFGSSHAACTVNNGILWAEGGIASYTLTAGAQKSDGTAYFVEEAISHNKPKVVLVETYLLPDVGFDEGAFYRSALTTRFSIRFVKYVFDVIKSNDLGREMLENMLIRMPMVHSRYKELSYEDFAETKKYSIGYVGSRDISAFDEPELTSDISEVSEKAIEKVDKIIDVCHRNGVELIFFAAPYVADAGAQAQQNYLRNYVENKGCRYLDFIQTYKKYEIDFASDFRDYEHLNDFGAEKITRALMVELENGYGLPDRRGEKGYERWDEHARFLGDRQTMYELMNCQDIVEYGQVLLKYKDNLTLDVKFEGNYRALGDDLFWPLLSEFGMSMDEYEAGGEISTGTDDAQYNGISIDVVDDEIGYTLDSIYVDVYEGIDIRRRDG